MCYNIQLTLTIGFLLLTTCRRAKGVSPTMQKIAAFIVKKRKLLLVVMLALAVVCAALMPFVGINTDMTKYLPDSSQMKIGMDRTYLASIEVGGRNVPLQNLAKIANGFDMTLSEFFEGIPRIDPRE